MFVRAYLMASASGQDASRARHALGAFAAQRGLRIAVRYIESESGTWPGCTELFRLLAGSDPGDILLAVQVDLMSASRRPDRPHGKV